MIEDNPPIITEFLGQNDLRVQHIILNKPQQLNAFSHLMIKHLAQAINHAQQDHTIAATLISSNSDKAFSAGANIKEIYQLIVDGNYAEAQQFFEDEYWLDYLIYTARKPVITFAHGLVIGAGSGIMQGSRYRIATQTTSFSMPEVLIGLYPDAGANFFLNRIKKSWGKFIAYSGVGINATDLQQIGLADRILDNKQLSPLKEELGRISWSECNAENNNIVFNILKSLEEKASPPQPTAVPHQAIIEQALDESCLENALDNLKSININNELFNSMRHNLNYASPTSLAIAERSLNMTALYSVAEALCHELMLTANIIRQSEHPEGVRALLIDRDRRPQWKYSKLSTLPDEWLDAFFSKPWPTNPLYARLT